MLSKLVLQARELVRPALSSWPVPSRRALLLAAVAALAVLVAAALAQVQSDDGDTAASSSTLEATFVDRDGDGFLERGPGEALVDRTELAPADTPAEELAVFAQITDAHVADEESPARLEMLDRLGAPFTSAFRPQESLTPHVLAAAVRSVNELGGDAVVVTGDLVDNAQANELEQALAVLQGGRVEPDSGGPGYEGVQGAANADPFYYRPATDPPREPTLLATAQQPFVSPGLRAPWYPVIGNHDILVAGNVTPSHRMRAVAVGGRKLVHLRRDVLDLADEQQLTPTVVNSLLELPSLGRETAVTPDAKRSFLSSAEVARRLRRASGHGGTGRLMDYSFDIGRSVRAIVLDTTRRDAGADGIVRPAQVRWLRQQLRAAAGRRVVLFSHAPLSEAVGGEAALAVLDANPSVVAAVGGHVHRNSIVPRRTRRGGYWLITTAGLADYPQQARAFRLARTAEGRIALETWMLDHDPASPLAATSRRLAFLDFQGGRPRSWAGRRLDRNAVLYLP
jgi:metallophosphoesterase (TIGR03767 family)